MKIVRNTLKYLVIALCIIILISTVGVEMIYTALLFNKHIDYTSIKEPSQYGITAIEHDVTTEDNYRIHIYEVETEQPKAVVLYLSGIQQPSVTYFYSHSQMLKENGYASILIDVRGHGKSEGNRIDFGIEEVKDVQAVVDFVKEQDIYRDVPIVVHGVSMGGAIAVTSASLIPEIDGLIAMSAFASWADVCKMELGHMGYNSTIQEIAAPFIHINGFWRYGFDYFNNRPKEAIKQIGDKPTFIMHAYGDTTVPIENMYKIKENHNGKNLHIWVRPSSAHLVVEGNKIADPFSDTEYCTNVLSFLEKYFGNNDIGEN